MKKHENSIADEIVQGLSEFAEALEQGDVGERFTCRKVVLDLRPEPYTPDMVRAARKKLSASQALFAKFLGVSLNTVRSWEQGLSTPSKLACRFMDEISCNPKYWFQRLMDATRPKPKLPKKLV
jgi:putative transcriptional regulator